MRTSDTSYGTQGSTTHRRRRVMRAARHDVMGLLMLGFRERPGVGTARPARPGYAGYYGAKRFYDIRQNPP